jgi:putative resolvase
MGKNKEKKWYTTQQVAEIVGITQTTVIAYCEKDFIEYSKTFGGHRRISADELRRLISKFADGEETQ